MIDFNFSFQPKQKLFLKTIDEKPVTFYGGARGGGKSKGLRMIMVLRRLQYYNSHGAIFRRTYSELEGNHIRPIFEEYPQLKEYWNESKKLITFPNGSTLQFCHCANEQDVDLYQGREFHDLAIDEAGQWTESMFRKLQGSNRSSKWGIKAKTILTGNPGGLGHKWLKRLFIEKRYNNRERADDYAFIQALVDDNKALIENDPDYVHRLESEPNEAIRRAYRYGDWDIFAGQFFQEMRREIHFIPAFTIPDHWNRFGAYDYGFNHPAAFGWFAVDEDSTVYLYRELVKAQQRIDQFAEQLNKFQDTENLYPIVAGWDCWTKRNTLIENSPPTIAEEFQKYNIQLKRASIDRVNGSAQLRSYLAWQGRPNNKPRLYIMDNCPITYDCLTRMIHDENHIEDVLKINATEGDPMSGDDAYDMIRYALMTRPSITESLKVPLKWGTKEWQDQQVKKMEEQAIEYFEKLEKNVID